MRLGSKHTEEAKRKIGLAPRGRFVSEETRKKIRANLKNNPPLFSEETRQKLSIANTGQKRTQAFKKYQSDLKIGKMPLALMRDGMYGNVKRGWYDINGKKMFFRSKWEVNYALYLDFLKKQKVIKDWKGEGKVFIFEKIQFGTRSYRPDFEVVNNKGEIEYHEVKGYMDNKSKTKLKRMRIYFPEVKVILIDKEQYSDIVKKVGKLLKFY